jgi:hypothetical protein
MIRGGSWQKDRSAVETFVELCFDAFEESESGRGESNSRLELGRLLLCH